MQLWRCWISPSRRGLPLSALAGGGIYALLIRAQALVMLSQGREAENVLASIPAGGLSDTQLAQLSTIRAANLLWTLGRPADADSIMQDAARSPHAIVRRTLSEFRVAYLAGMGRPLDAIDLATTAE